MRKNFFYLLIIISFSTAIYFLFKNSISYNIQSSNYLVMNLFSKISPQGWGFFTKSPREENVYIYSLDNNELNAKLSQNSSYKNFFGISKKSRMVAFEISIILSQLKDKKWENYTLDYTKLDLHKIDNKNLHYLKSGKYLLVKEKVPPYTWRHAIKNKNKLIEVLYVSCNKK